MTAPVRFAFEGITGGYGAMMVVRGLSAEVGEGQCLCVLGRNGVGKTTLMNVLSGHLGAAEGSILLNGRNLVPLSPDARRRQGMSYAMQERPVFDHLSVFDNLMLMRASAGIGLYRPYFDRFPILENRLDQKAGTLSGGERKILSFTRALAEEGDITLLDEPSEGVQSENISHMETIITEAKSRGRCFVVVEQHLHLAEAIADQYLIIDQGKCVLQRTAAGTDRQDLLAHLEV